MRNGVKLLKTINLYNEEIYKFMGTIDIFVAVDERESHDGSFRPYEFVNGVKTYNGTYRLCEKNLEDFKNYNELLGFIDEYTKDGDAIAILNTAWSNYDASKRLEDNLRERYKDRLVPGKMEELENYYDENKDLLNKVCKWLKDNANQYAGGGIDTEKMIKALKESIGK